MANSDKNIIVTPNTGNTADPSIVFSGANTSVSAQDITLKVYPYDQGTLSFEGVNGQILAIDNANTGTSFSVNDMSGLPSIDVSDLGVIRLMPYPTDVIATTFGANTVIGAGTTTIPAISTDYRNLLTTPAAGAFENNNGYLHFTNNTTAGRAQAVASNYYRLTANGAAIGATADFFGANSAIPLDSGATYEIEFECIYTKTTSGQMIWSIQNTSTVSLEVHAITSADPTGATASPTGTSVEIGALIAQTASTVSFTATGSFNSGAIVTTRIKVYVSSGTSTSLRLRAESGAGTLTPMRGSYWKRTHIPSTNIGTYAT